MSRVTRGQGRRMVTLYIVPSEQQRSVSGVAAAAAGTIFGTEVRSGAVSELYSALCRTGAPPHQTCWDLPRANYRLDVRIVNSKS